MKHLSLREQLGPSLDGQLSPDEGPIVPRDNPVRVSTRWQMLVGIGLTKAYSFEDRLDRDRFVVRCVALETYRRQADVTWTIVGDRVEVFLKTGHLGLTEPVAEFAKQLDDVKRDLELSGELSYDDDDARLAG